MQEKLLVYVQGLDVEQVSWLVVDQQSQALQQSEGAVDQNFADLARGKKIILLLSASDVLLRSVSLPKMSRTRLMQAVPYALEEQLLDEPENLHFAIGPRHPDDSIPVAVVNKLAFSLLLNRLKRIGIQPDQVVPVILTLPMPQNNWSVVANHHILLRSGDYQGFTCEKENFADFLTIALAETNNAPEKLIIYSQAQDEWQLPIEIEQHQLQSDQWLQILVPQLESNISINLLQGEFAAKSSSMPSLGGLSKISVYLVALLFFVLLLYPLGSYIILQKRADSLNAAIETIYKKHFPKAKKMVSPRRRMQDMLDKSKIPAGDNQLFLLLGYIAKDMSPNIQLQQFNYQNNVLKLQLNAASSDVLDQFTQALEEQGLKVRQQNVNVVNKGVTATLEIR